MLKITIELSGNDSTPESDGHDPDGLNVNHRLEFHVSNNPMNGPTIKKQTESFKEIAEFIETELGL